MKKIDKLPVDPMETVVSEQSIVKNKINEVIDRVNLIGAVILAPSGVSEEDLIKLNVFIATVKGKKR